MLLMRLMFRYPSISLNMIVSLAIGFLIYALIFFSANINIPYNYQAIYVKSIDILLGVLPGIITQMLFANVLSFLSGSIAFILNTPRMLQIIFNKLVAIKYISYILFSTLSILLNTTYKGIAQLFLFLTFFSIWHIVSFLNGHQINIEKGMFSAMNREQMGRSFEGTIFILCYIYFSFYFFYDYMDYRIMVMVIVIGITISILINLVAYNKLNKYRYKIFSRLGGNDD